MLDFLKENKLLGGIFILVIVGAGAYFAINAGKTDDLLTSTAASSASQVSQELLLTLADLRAIKLDNTLFTDEVFTSLVDFGVEIPLQPIGRDNPFAPLKPQGGTLSR